MSMELLNSLRGRLSITAGIGEGSGGGGGEGGGGVRER